VWVAFAVSAAIHALLIALYPLFGVRLGPPSTTIPYTSAADEVDGMQVIRLVEVEPADDEPEEPPPPVEPEEPEDAEPRTPGVALPDVAGAPRADSTAPGLSMAERLRPRLTDERLWGPVNAALGTLTPAQREELLVAGRLQEWVDSVRAAEEAEAALTDWTVTDSEGKRWGVADGKLYLGDFVVPVPFEFGTTPGNREEVNQRMYEWEEIMRQGRQMELRDSWRERSEAIRQRRDRERAIPDSARGGPGGD